MSENGFAMCFLLEIPIMGYHVQFEFSEQCIIPKNNTCCICLSQSISCVNKTMVRLHRNQDFKQYHVSCMIRPTSNASGFRGVSMSTVFVGQSPVPQAAEAAGRGGAGRRSAGRRSGEPLAEPQGRKRSHRDHDMPKTMI